MQGLIAKKLGMSRVFLPSGEAVAVTYLRIEPNKVIRTKSQEKDGYNAVVLGLDGKLWKTRKGKEYTRFRHQKEWKVPSLEGLEPGKNLDATLFPVESTVTIMGVSKGKGFQGVIKRHHFSGGPATHGSHFKREPGSIGMREHPGRVFKGHRMAGHMGNRTVTLKRRTVVVSDPNKGIIGVKGPVPGSNGTVVYLTLETPADASS